MSVQLSPVQLVADFARLHLALAGATGLDWNPARRDPDRIARHRPMPEDLSARLRAAKLYLVTAERTQLAAKVGQMFEGYELRAEHLPAPAGFMHFHQAPFAVTNKAGTHTVTVIAVSWYAQEHQVTIMWWHDAHPEIERRYAERDWERAKAAIGRFEEHAPGPLPFGSFDAMPMALPPGVEPDWEVLEPTVTGLETLRAIWQMMELDEGTVQAKHRLTAMERRWLVGRGLFPRPVTIVKAREHDA